MAVTLDQQYNVGDKPTVILYTYITFQQVMNMFRRNVPPDWGMLRRSRCVQIFLQIQTLDYFFNNFYAISEQTTINMNTAFVLHRPYHTTCPLLILILLIVYHCGKRDGSAKIGSR